MKVVYGLKNEKYEDKLKWFLSLSPTQRYIRMLEMASFSKLKNKRRRLKDRRAFKTVQILSIKKNPKSLPK